MAQHKTVSAKISHPSVSGAVQRARLFSLLDGGLAKPVTWISAPGGSGKSTLVASYLDARQLPCLWYQCDAGDADLATFFYYMGLAARKAAPRFKKPLPLLTAEYLAGIPTFSRRYFETLYSRLTRSRTTASPHGFFIVLDNFQDVPADSPFHDVISIGLDCIPDEVHVVVISRSEPPVAVARLQAHDKINLLRYSDVRFTLEESGELARGRVPHLDGSQLELLHTRTEGWAAGIILMMERGNLDGTMPETSYDRVFDYFAGELFNKADSEVQEFLLKTAFLPLLTVRLTEKLTGITSAGRILSVFNSHHLFTEKLSGSGLEFQYHPLLRAFLIDRARNTFTPGELVVLQCETAHLLELSGQIEDAARLYCQAGDREGLARMVIRHAEEFLRQGRGKTIEEWLACIPDSARNNDPWLLYWSGICSFPIDMPRTRGFLERALELFKVSGDVTGLYLSWAGIVDTYAFGDGWKNLDDCIRLFEDLQNLHPTYPASEIELLVSSRMLISLTLRKTDQPHRVEEALQHVLLLLQKNPSFDILMDSMFFMSVYYLWKGEYDKNAVLLERAEAEIRHRTPSPFAVIRIRLMKGIHCWISAEYDSARQAFSEGLELSAQSGVFVYESLLWGFMAAADMAPGHLELAEISLKKQMASLLGVKNTLNTFFYHINSSWYALLSGNALRAAEHLETISETMEEMGTPYYRALWHIGMAQVALLQGRTDVAKSCLKTVHHISLTMQSQVMEWYALLIEAHVLLQEGQETEGVLALFRGLSLGRRHGYVHLEFYQPKVMCILCAKALQEQIEPEYVTGLVRKLQLKPPVSAGTLLSGSYPEEWPYRIKIRTLGRFEIRCDDIPLEFSGKEQKKPLEMLKVLIAFGGADVSRERMIDVLWPDAEGDQAQKSFEMTLSRLRKLLVCEEVVIYRARQLALNPIHCRVDSLALGGLFERIGETTADAAVQLCEKAVALYKGVFLPADMGQSWAVACRETLQNRMLRAISLAGRHFEQAGEWERAAGYFSKGIEIDSLAEEFYRRLMICHRMLGNHADAARTYNRCRSLLQSELGIQPSPETTAVYSSIIQKQ